MKLIISIPRLNRKDSVSGSGVKCGLGVIKSQLRVLGIDGDYNNVITWVYCGRSK